MLKKLALFLLIVFIGVGAVGLWLSFSYPAESPVITEQTSPAEIQDPVTTAPGETQASGYTAVEVEKHATSQDCWLIVRDNVYDVDTFISSHPGGVDALSKQCGNEVSDLFASIHSNRAWDLLGSYKIGKLIE